MKRLVALALLTGLSGSLVAATTYRVCNLSNENISVETEYSKVIPLTGQRSQTFSLKAGEHHDITFGVLSIAELEEIKIGNAIAHYDPSMLKKGDNTIGLYQVGNKWGVVIAKGTDCSRAKTKMLELK